MQIIKFIVLAAISLYFLGGVGLYLIQDTIIFQATSLPEDFQYEFSFDYEERNFVMSDQAVINGLLIKTDSAKGIIFYHHGNAGDLSRWGEIGAYFIQFGYDVLIYDYRGYGKSTGEESRTMERMYRDGQEIYDYLKMTYGEQHIILYGRSLGTGITSWLAGHNQPDKVILETPYYSMTHVAAHHYRIYPARFLVKYPFPSHQFLKDSNRPVYIFHGTDDRVVPYESGQLLAKSVQSDVDLSFTTIEGGRHNNLIEYEQYRTGIRAILN